MSIKKVYTCDLCGERIESESRAGIRTGFAFLFLSTGIPSKIVLRTLSDPDCSRHICEPCLTALREAKL